MKKNVLLGLSIIVLGIGATSVYAKEVPKVQTPTVNINREYTEKDWEEIHKSKIKYRKAELKELLDKKLITKEEYDYKLKRMEERDKILEEKGYNNGYHDGNHNINHDNHKKGRGHHNGNHNGLGCNAY